MTAHAQATRIASLTATGRRSRRVGFECRLMCLSHSMPSLQTMGGTTMTEGIIA